MTSVESLPDDDAGMQGVRPLIRHSAAVFLLSLGACVAYAKCMHWSLTSSDGLNYATVARNYSEGRGLLSSVIQPGLMCVVPTDRVGQAYVIQSPLWSMLLAEWYQVAGTTEAAVLLLCFLLCAAATVESWWIAYLATRRIWPGYLAVALLLLNPHYMACIGAGFNVALQSVILAGLALSMFRRAGVATVAVAGILVVLGLLTRETSVFIVPGLLLAWFCQTRTVNGRSPWLRMAAIGLALAMLIYGTTHAESVRRSAALGGGGSPTLHMTFLYWTRDFDLGWYFIYDYVGLRTDPVQYFLANPGQLASKIGFQIWVLFIKQTVGSLLAEPHWFVPVIIPFALERGRARIVAWSVLLALLVQTAVSTITTLHAHYYLAYLPVLGALIAGSVHGLGKRGREWSTMPGRTRSVLRLALIAYALAPLAWNAAARVRGEVIVPGDMAITAHQRVELDAFVLENTSGDAVIVASHSPMIAWDTRRTVIQYSGHPNYCISDSEMWRRIDQHTPIDYILLSSLGGPRPPIRLLPQFSLARELHTGDLDIWLFARDR